MAANKNAEVNPETQGLLATAARSLGHAAGHAAKAFGFEGGAAMAPALSPKPASEKVKTAKRASARTKRSTTAAELKESATALGKAAGFDDVRYRRIMGKAATVWSDQDIDYIDGLVKVR